MPSGSDFVSPTIVLQALLALLGAMMAWRGAHLSGDHKRRHSVAWGAASVATFLIALSVGAFGNHESAKLLKDATDRAEKVQTSLEALQGQNSSLLNAMEKIAGKAEVNPNQSTQALADQVINKISNFQTQLDAAKSSITLLQNPPHDPDYLYQGEKAVAKFWDGTYWRERQKFYFLKISDAGDIDFSAVINFRGLELRCVQPEMIFGSEMNINGTINNVIRNVTCDVISGTIVGITNPPIAPPAFPTLQPPLGEK